MLYLKVYGAPDFVPPVCVEQSTVFAMRLCSLHHVITKSSGTWRDWRNSNGLLGQTQKCFVWWDIDRRQLFDRSATRSAIPGFVSLHPWGQLFRLVAIRVRSRRYLVYLPGSVSSVFADFASGAALTSLSKSPSRGRFLPDFLRFLIAKPKVLLRASG